MATKPKAPTYTAPKYESKYEGQLDSALDKVVNRKEFSYDPLQDANYQALAKVYDKRGQQASENVLGNAASLNGGYGSSYAVTASQQAINDYNQELASNIPALAEQARGRYMDEHQLNMNALGALRDADTADYGKHRDTVADKQWKYGQDYGKYRDSVADAQWQKSYDRAKYESNRDYNYQKRRDRVSDSHWSKEFALQKKSAAGRSGGRSGGGGGRGGRGGRYIGGSRGGTSSSNGGRSSNFEKALYATSAGMAVGRAAASGIGGAHKKRK